MSNEIKKKKSKRSKQSEDDYENKVLISIDIQLSENEMTTLTISPDDVIEDKILQFCKENNLSSQARRVLSKQVIDQLDAQILQVEAVEEQNTNQSFSSFSNSTNNMTINKEKFKNKNQSSKINRKKAHTPESNPGERLYRQYMERLPKILEKRKQIQNEEEESKENENNSFTPKIDKNSKRMVQSKYYGKIEDKLISYGNQSKEKIKKEVELKNEMELSQCNFKPHLNRKTKVLGGIKRRIREEELPEQTIAINPEYLKKQKSPKSADVSFGNSSQNNFTAGSSTSDIEYKTYYNPKHKVNKTTKIYHRNVPVPKLDPSNKLHDFLYIESKIIEEKKEKKRKELTKEQCPFKPNLSQTSRVNNRRHETRSNILSRLLEKPRLLREHSADEPRISQLKDSVTGQKLFKPNILRGPKDNNQRNMTDILFDKKLIEDKKKINNEKMNITLEKKKMFYGRSREIIIKMKIEKYKEIFNSLDSDHDGLISSRSICLAVLDQDLLEALTPLLEELQKKRCEMNFKDFCVRVDKYLTLKIFSDKDFMEQ